MSVSLTIRVHHTEQIKYYEYCLCSKREAYNPGSCKEFTVLELQANEIGCDCLKGYNVYSTTYLSSVMAASAYICREDPPQHCTKVERDESMSRDPPETSKIISKVLLSMKWDVFEDLEKSKKSDFFSHSGTTWHGSYKARDLDVASVDKISLKHNLDAPEQRTKWYSISSVHDLWTTARKRWISAPGFMKNDTSNDCLKIRT